MDIYCYFHRNSIVKPGHTGEGGSKNEDFCRTSLMDAPLVSNKLSNQRIHGIKVNRWLVPQLKNIHLVWQLLSGHNKLNKFMSMINVAPSPLCKCGQIEDSEHYMFRCERYSLARFELLMELELISGTKIKSLSEVAWSTLAGQNQELSKQTNERILKEVIKFIVKTKRF